MAWIEIDCSSVIGIGFWKPNAVAELCSAVTSAPSRRRTENRAASPSRKVKPSTSASSETNTESEPPRASTRPVAQPMALSCSMFQPFAASTAAGVLTGARL